MFINFKVSKLTCVNRNKDSCTFGKVVDYDGRQPLGRLVMFSF